MNDKLTWDNGDLLPEYDLDYSKAKPNHYAAARKREREATKPPSEKSAIREGFDAVYDTQDSSLDPVLAQIQFESLPKEYW